MECYYAQRSKPPGREVLFTGGLRERSSDWNTDVNLADCTKHRLPATTTRRAPCTACSRVTTTTTLCQLATPTQTCKYLNSHTAGHTAVRAARTQEEAKEEKEKKKTWNADTSWWRVTYPSSVSTSVWWDGGVKPHTSKNAHELLTKTKCNSPASAARYQLKKSSYLMYNVTI